MAEIKEIIGQKINKYRSDMDMTQQQLADILQINRSSVSLIENGTQEPDLNLLVKIIKLTKIDLLELLELNFKKYVVLDTSVIINCPQILNSAIAYCDKVYIPYAVIEEINYQKNHGTEAKKKLASLCMNKIIELKSEKFIQTDNDFLGKNDDKIFSVAKRIAQENVNDYVYLLTNDKDFKLKDLGKINNLKVISSVEFNLEFKQNISYNNALSQKFYDAVMRKDIELAKTLSEKNINVNHIDGKTGFTPLIKAIRDKNIPMINYLLTLPTIDINAVDEQIHKLPPLSHAVQMHNIKIVQLLISNGANVNAPSQSDKNAFNTPLMIASWSGDLDIVNILIENGACINQQDKGNGFTPLIKAVYQNKPDIVKCLLKHRADKNISSFEGKTAIDYAFEKNINHKYIEIIKMLKEEGD